MLHPVQLVGQFGVFDLVPLNSIEPGVAQLLSTAADAFTEMLVDAVGDEELGVLGPVVIPLGEPDLLLAQGLAVRGAGVLLVGAPQPMWLSTMIRVGRSRSSMESAEGSVEHIQVVGISHPGDVPAVAQ